MNDKKFRSGFKRIPVNDVGGQKIKTLQEDFDRFWHKINRQADKSTEKYYALKAMQEACMWMSRAIAIQNEIVPKVIIDDPIMKEPLVQKSIAETLAKYKEGEQIRIKNSPHIILKKKHK